MLHTHICAVESVAQLTGVSRGNHDSGRCVRKNKGWKIGGGMGGGGGGGGVEGEKWRCVAAYACIVRLLSIQGPTQH